MTITFTADTAAAPRCTVEAHLQHDHAEILSVTDENGRTVPTTSEDLDRFEAHLFPEETPVEATCPETGRKDTFTVRHNGESIGRIQTSHGYRVGRSTELFTEVAECFHIDRYWRMMEESDVQGHARRCYC